MKHVGLLSFLYASSNQNLGRGLGQKKISHNCACRLHGKKHASKRHTSKARQAITWLETLKI
jgi:hypothetical protein